MAKKSKASKAAKAVSKQSNGTSSNGVKPKQLKAQPAPSSKPKPAPAGSKKPKVSAAHAQPPKATPKQAKGAQKSPVVSHKAKKAGEKAQPSLAVPQKSGQAAGKAVCPVQTVPGEAKASASCHAVTCAENIALLELLTPLPGKTTNNPQHGQAERVITAQATRTLSFEQESELATTLAFLSGISDDSNHVTAVALEELPDTGQCKVLIAINKPNPDRGNEIQGQIYGSFKQIFGQLAKMSPTSSKEARLATREAVFDSIVALCQSRILTRLGLRKSKRAYTGKIQKRPIGSILAEVLQAQWQGQANGRQLEMKQDAMRRYRLQSEALLESLHKLEAMNDPKHGDIAQVVRSISRYMSDVPLNDLLGCLSTQPVPRESQDRLFNCLSKVARYRESATFLCRAAGKFDMLRDAILEEVHLPEEAFAKPPKGMITGDVQSILTRLSQKQSAQTHNLPPWVQEAITAATAGEFTTEINRRLQEARIHAEIQILAHYEYVSPDVVPPRIIASSKSACYLCDTFIRLHSKFSVPKSHGKLYPGWRLPAMPQLDPLQQRLNAFLQQEILATIKTLSQIGARPVNKFLNESTIFPLHLSASVLTALSSHSSADLSSRAGPGRVDINKRTPTGTFEKDVDTRRPQDALAGSLHELSRVASLDQNSRLEEQSGRAGPDRMDEDHDGAGIVYTVDLDEKRIFSETGNDSSCACATTVEQSPSLLLQPATGGDGWFYYNNMEIFIESPAEVTPKWLNPEDSVAVLSNQAGQVVDVFSMVPGTEISSLPRSADGKTYFSFGDQVIMMDTRGP